MTNIWEEITDVYTSMQPINVKYKYLSDILHRLCVEQVKGLATEYNDFYSRLQAVCRLTNYPLHGIDQFRWRARQISHYGMETDEKTFLNDMAVLCDAIAHFTNSRIPTELKRNLPSKAEVSVFKADKKQIERYKHIRFIVSSISDNHILAFSKEIPSTEPFKIDFTSNAQTMEAMHLLHEGMQFNALSYTIDNEGVYHPLYIIIEPDFLLDITSITSCLKEYGDSPFIHFISKMQPSQSTQYTLLGDFANQFLDDAFNTPDSDYLTSMRKVFASKAMDICACDKVDKDFFDETSSQFKNIRQVVENLYQMDFMKDNNVSVQLEPSFFCEAMGVQGRMDCLIDLANNRKFLIELKSGKWDEFHKCAKTEHLMQMLLYKEILYYNMNVKQADVMGNLLYSKYPKLQEQRSFQEIVFQAMTIRNKIVCMELGLIQGKASEWVPKLTPEKLRTKPCNEKFWRDWCVNDLKKVTDALHSMDEITSEYFYTFLKFIEREQFESKIDDTRPDSTRALSSLWNADINTKIENGDIFLNLTLKELRFTNGVDAVCLNRSNEEDCQPNFRVGDSVILYKRNTSNDSAITQQVIRCNVESYNNSCIWLKLKYPQSNKDVFSMTSLYAIEHDHIESNFRSLYSGLYSLVNCDKSRRDLLLCQRKATSDDMFLLMGPPGTGKTSVALKRMVEEHLEKKHNILLLAYTNRAVDEICQMLSTINDMPAYLRLGRELSCAPEYHEHLFENTMLKMKNRQQLMDKIGETTVFVSTVSSLNSHTALLKLKHFNVAMFDEASQILEPQILGILTSPSIDKFIMIGDHKQLPAVVVQSEEHSAVKSDKLNKIGLYNCRNSLFERLYEQNKDNSDVVSMLDHQGRMHPSIADFVSKSFYDGRLLPVGLPHQKGELEFSIYDEDNIHESLIATNRCAFVNVPIPMLEDRMPKANLLEAKMIAKIIEAIISLHTKNNIQFSLSKQIGIIVPFRRQIALVRQEIEKLIGSDETNSIMIDTVERYQGSQRDIIIYGTTITKRYELDNLSNTTLETGAPVDRKLNVAITRARKQLFILGNEKLLRQNKIYNTLIDYCKNKGGQ